MAKPTPSRMFALAALAAIAVGLVTPACAMTYSRNGAQQSDLVYVPLESNCRGRGYCDLARY
jgi:hypothetical protein